MPKFTNLKGVTAPLDIQNIDTDMIIPKEYAAFRPSLPRPFSTSTSASCSRLHRRRLLFHLHLLHRLSTSYTRRLLLFHLHLLRRLSTS